MWVRGPLYPPCRLFDAQVRKLLRRRHGIDRGIPVVLSTEKPRCKLVDMTGGGNLSDFQVGAEFHLVLCMRRPRVGCH